MSDNAQVPAKITEMCSILSLPKEGEESRGNEGSALCTLRPIAT